MNEVQFRRFPSIERLYRGITITEKLDGANMSVLIHPSGVVQAASRERIITPEEDCYGFAAWVADHQEDLCQLGPGQHSGEWWGDQVNRKYPGAKDQFSLFNTKRWLNDDLTPAGVPSCCRVVPVLYRGPFSDSIISCIMGMLSLDGSIAHPGAASEGVVLYFHDLETYAKVTFGDPKKLSGPEYLWDKKLDRTRFRKQAAPHAL